MDKTFVEAMCTFIPQLSLDELLRVKRVVDASVNACVGQEHADLKLECLRLCASGQKLLAVKHAKEVLHCGLKEAKEFVDSLY